LADDHAVRSRRDVLKCPKVPADHLPKVVGVTSVSVIKHPNALTFTDTTIV
jgi:hypothetical protein